VSLEEVDHRRDTGLGDHMVGVRQDRQFAVPEIPVGGGGLLDGAELVAVAADGGVLCSEEEIVDKLLQVLSTVIARAFWLRRERAVISAVDSDVSVAGLMPITASPQP